MAIVPPVTLNEILESGDIGEYVLVLVVLVLIFMYALGVVVFVGVSSVVDGVLWCITGGPGE